MALPAVRDRIEFNIRVDFSRFPMEGLMTLYHQRTSDVYHPSDPHLTERTRNERLISVINELRHRHLDPMDTSK